MNSNKNADSPDPAPEAAMSKNDPATITLESTLNNEAEITLGLLNAVHENSALTQRNAAHELGIALGLANAYLKRCVKKGLIKVSQAPANRYAYYLTPQGFAEKSKLTAQYLSSSLTFFRRARAQCSEAFEHCQNQGWTRIALAGASELCEISTLSATDHGIELLGIIDPKAGKDRLAGLAIVAQLSDLDSPRAVLVTDLDDPQATYESLLANMPEERILTPRLLRISRNPNKADEGGNR